jgi:hypothetical protein
MDIAIPDEGYSFGTLFNAQAAGTKPYKNISAVCCVCIVMI